MREKDFTAMVCSKILHDLAGPIGAIMNGTELLEESKGGENKEYLELLKTSSEQLTAMLQVYRVGFGAMSTGGKDIETAMVQDHLETFSRFKGVAVHWQPEETKIDKVIGKILMNSVFLLIDSARKKGELQISCTRAGDQYSFSVAAFGQGIKAPSDLKMFFSGGKLPDLTTKNVSAYLIAQLATDKGLKISLVETSTGVVLRGKTKGK